MSVITLCCLHDVQLAVPADCKGRFVIFISSTMKIKADTGLCVCVCVRACVQGPGTRTQK